ncbi:hypothetical protein [Microbacterium sp. 3J1]|uniref:hypothetical protein n=1 Tax=Microbacterium sp. 3J1 TaxID=861269 RepID=UPI000A71DB9F|nr:hypothetical protein [Microbacterium sp. 3J1]
MKTKAPLFINCPRCNRRVLEVREDFELGVLVGTPRLDAVQLKPDHIVACIITGIRLWQIQERAGHTITSGRSRWWPREPVPGFTVPEHSCGRVWDAPAIDLAPDEIVYPDQPPF